MLSAHAHNLTHYEGKGRQLSNALQLSSRCRIIGASRSEPHTGDTNRDFPFICVYNIIRPSVPYIAAFYFNDIQYFIPILCACVIRYETIARGSSELIEQLKKERAKKEERLRKTSKERSQKETYRDTRT